MSFFVGINSALKAGIQTVGETARSLGSGITKIKEISPEKLMKVEKAEKSFLGVKETFDAETSFMKDVSEKNDWASTYDSNSKQYCLETNSDSRLLNGELPANATISVYNNSTDTKIIYETDDLSRCKSVQCSELRMSEGTRNKYQQSICNDLKDGIPGSDDAGHFIAREFGGNGEQINLTPMDSYINRHGEWRYLERSWEKTLNEGGTIKDVKIEPYYDEMCKRPSEFDVSFKKNGKSESIYISNDTNLIKGA